MAARTFLALAILALATSLAREASAQTWTAPAGRTRLRYHLLYGYNDGTLIYGIRSDRLTELRQKFGNRVPVRGRPFLMTITTTRYRPTGDSQWWYLVRLRPARPTTPPPPPPKKPQWRTYGLFVWRGRWESVRARIRVDAMRYAQGGAYQRNIDQYLQDMRRAAAGWSKYRTTKMTVTNGLYAKPPSFTPNR